MELNQIRYFLEVAKTQHITNSAKKLHIAQPSLTQAIHRLEESVGVPLFVSKGRNITLTEYGKYLEKKLIPIIDELDSLPEKLHVMAKLADKTIHLNVLAASALVTDAIIEYKREHKDINFQLLQNNQENLYDIEITTKASDSSNNEEKLQGKNEFICHEKIYLAVPNNEKYKGRTSIDLREMMDEGFISLAGSKQFSAICEKFCHTLGVKPKIIFESDNPSAVKNMIMANMGVGFWPQFTWGSVDEKHVRLLEIEGVLCQRDIVISYNLNKQDNSNVIAFYDFLKTRFFTK
ncbi:MAG: LysR family transcriptional regulator [Lachnospiraceae bacterium]|nr:LysR family transcriptional regulator [Lachnospiraceae bacterium]MEE0862047.1 LysR family transcriptional regulator [Lachnospiraceae bacterium]